MASIHVLDPHTAELIAAGEVVERPASAAKELVENAIDAGATQITVSITRGGIAQLQVSDNGSGIETEDIEKAFIRHATSKIRSEADLEHIHTLGFRGEALASIASVARVEVLTRTEPDEFACCYRIAGGVAQGMEPGARPVGTTITVNDLFYNTPARMKFLKKDVSEGTFVADVVLHAALSHPEISFHFLREGKQQFVTPGDGSLRSAAYAVLGRAFAKDLVEVEHERPPYRVSGLITPPRACRASRGAQHFYINGRYVKNRTIMAALENAFKGTLMQGKFPGGILCLTMPAELVDVNVHPAKTEVRFAREGDVFDAVYQAVKLALSQPGTGECRFDLGDGDAPEQAGRGLAALGSPARPTAPQPAPKLGQGFATLSAQEYRAKLAGSPPAKPEASPAARTKAQPAAPAPLGLDHPGLTALTVTESDLTVDLHSSWGLAPEPELTIYPEAPQPQRPEQPPAELPAPAPEEAPPLPEEPPLPPEQQAPPPAEQLSMGVQEGTEPLRYVGEVFKTYIITQRGDELCLIDKHAAHERVLFERLSQSYGQVPSQMLLSPVQVTLSAEEKQGLLQHRDLLADAGVELDDFGGGTVVVRSVPADVAVESVEDLVVELADKLAQGSRDALSEKTEWVLHSIACKAAIKAGDRTGAQELMHLAEQILSGSVPPFCPHGRPVVLKLTRKELEKQFGRIV